MEKRENLKQESFRYILHILVAFLKLMISLEFGIYFRSF